MFLVNLNFSQELDNSYNYLNNLYLNNYMKNNISPHVNIYKFPVTAISSIATRISGVGLTGFYLIGGISHLCNVDLYKKYEKLENPYKKVINYSIIVPSTYHTFGGLRHFIWDKYPKLLNNTQVARSSYLLFGATFATSILIEQFFN
tara:strand:+ start:240 stop:680 length:441 start_codon:yes stop_codon:yes gene_type:complete